MISRYFAPEVPYAKMDSIGYNVEHRLCTKCRIIRTFVFILSITPFKNHAEDSLCKKKISDIKHTET